MKSMWKTFILYILTILFLTISGGCQDVSFLDKVETSQVIDVQVKEDGYYTKAKDVAVYIRTFSHLPNNYVTKEKAQSMGWIPEKGNLRELGESLCIGGNRFGNREKLLPIADNRIYYECDVNYDGGHRGPYRLVYSNDGLIFYTDDHYRSFDNVTEEGP